MIKDFCYPDPKHPGFYICPWDHGDSPHLKIDPGQYPNVMDQLAEVWEEGRSAGYDQGIDEAMGSWDDEPKNPYHMFTPDEK